MPRQLSHQGPDWGQLPTGIQRDTTVITPGIPYQLPQRVHVVCLAGSLVYRFTPSNVTMFMLPNFAAVTNDKYVRKNDLSD